MSGYGAEAEGAGNGYLTYGYDEFGNDLHDSLYKDMEEAGIPNPYTRQGEGQPFGYTGYRRDDISGTYFAQAREYQPQNGRFTAEDVIKGNGAFPETLNPYVYCLGNPLALVDRDGKKAEMPSVIANNMLKNIIGEAFKKIEVIRKSTDNNSLSDENQTGYIKVADYNVADRAEFIKFMKYAESGNNFNGSLYDVDGDGFAETIGYGHDTSEKGDYKLYKDVTLDEKEGEALLIQDLKDSVPTDWLQYMEDQGHNFTPNEIDALVSLAFALGGVASKKKSPNLTTMIIEGNWTEKELSDEFLTYDKSNTDMSGLQKRHAAEAKIFMRGIYDTGFYDEELEDILCIE